MSIDTSVVRYDLIALPPSGERLHLMPLASELRWEEEPNELAVRLRAKLENRKLTEGWLHELLPLVCQMQLLADWGAGWQEVWRGCIFNWNLRDEGTHPFSVIAYDQLIYLAKSKDDRFYPAGTVASALLTDIANDWQIPLSTSGGPDVALGKNLFRGRSLADMIGDTLKQVKQRGAGKWILRSREGTAEVLRAGQNSPVYWLRADESVQSVEDHQDIDRLVTRVKILGTAQDDERAPVEAVIDGKTEFGILQELVIRNQYDSPDVAQKVADDLMEERGQPYKRRQLTAPDLPFMRRGDKVRVTAGTLDGYYLVSGISHDAGSRTMTVEVEDVKDAESQHDTPAAESAPGEVE